MVLQTRSKILLPTIPSYITVFPDNSFFETSNFCIHGVADMDIFRDGKTLKGCCKHCLKLPLTFPSFIPLFPDNSSFEKIKFLYKWSSRHGTLLCGADFEMVLLTWSSFLLQLFPSFLTLFKDHSFFEKIVV